MGNTWGGRSSPSLSKGGALGWFVLCQGWREVVVEHQLNGTFLAMCVLSPKRLNEVLGCVRRERILPFYGTGEADSGILHPVQVSAFKRGCWKVLKRATKMIEGLEKWPYKGENLKTSICLHY